jgi:hypothetical protein
MSLSDGATQYVPLDKLKIYQDSVLVNFLLRKLNFSTKFDIVENAGADTVDIDIGTEIQTLTDLIDVAITQPVQKHVLRYSGSQWENKQLNITDMGDVEISSPQLQGHVFRHNGTKWANTFPFLDDLVDVVVSTELTAQTLRHNGISWVNAFLSLPDLSDVNPTSPQDGDVLRFNGTQWVNVVASAINLAINDMTDVIITSAQTGQLIKFDGSNWVNSLVSLNNLTDVVLGALQTGQFIQYDGNDWINTPAIMDALTDVIITSPSNGQVLQYNGTHWVNATPTPGVVGLNDLSDVVLNSITVGDILRYNGSNFVNVDLAELLNITQLLDVNITTPTNGEVLKYNGALWVNDAVAAGVTQMDNLSDVTLTSPANNEALIYDFSTSQWRNQGLPSAPVSLDDLNDVIITTPTTGHILRHNGSAFVNTLLAELISLTQLSDVTITSPTTNQVVGYNGSAWVNQSIAAASEKSFLPDTINNGSNWGIWNGGARAGTGLFAGAAGFTSASTGSRQDSTTGGKVVTAFITGSSNDDQAGFHGDESNTTGLYVRRDQNFKMKCKIQLPDITTVRFAIGVAALEDLPGNTDTILDTGVEGFLFYWSSTITSNIELRRNNASGSSVDISTGVSVSTNTPITFEIIADEANSRIGWAINEGSITYYTTDIPSATTSMNYFVKAETKTNGTKELQQYYTYLIQDPT